MLKRIKNLLVAFFMFSVPFTGYGLTFEPMDFVIINPVILMPTYPIIIPDLIPVIPLPSFYSIERLTNSTDNESYPDMSNSKIAWFSYGGSNYKLNYKNRHGDTSNHILVNNMKTIGPLSVYEDEIYWSQELTTSDYDIKRWKGVISTIISGTTYDFAPSVSGETIAYLRTNGVFLGADLMLGASRLSDKTSVFSFPSNYDGKVAWSEYDGSDSEIFYYDNGNITQLTNNALDDSFPKIHNGGIAWAQNDGNDSEIMYWNGSTITQITNNDKDDINPSLYNGKIAWQYNDGTDYEIKYWDGTIIYTVTSNSTNDTMPKLYNGAIVWEGFASDTVSKEIYFAKVATPEIPAPNEAEYFTAYSALTSPTVENMAKYCKPLSLGDIAAGTLNIKIGTPNFESAIDIYIGVYAPAIWDNIQLITSTNDFQDLNVGLTAWKTNVTSAINNESLFGDIATSALPSGSYTFYVMITPHGSTSDYYLWETSFTK